MSTQKTSNQEPTITVIDQEIFRDEESLAKLSEQAKKDCAQKAELNAKLPAIESNIVEIQARIDALKAKDAELEISIKACAGDIAEMDKIGILANTVAIELGTANRMLAGLKDAHLSIRSDLSRWQGKELRDVAYAERSIAAKKVLRHLYKAAQEAVTVYGEYALKQAIESKSYALHYDNVCAALKLHAPESPKEAAPSIEPKPYYPQMEFQPGILNGKTKNLENQADADSAVKIEAIESLAVAVNKNGQSLEDLKNNPANVNQDDGPQIGQGFPESVD